jgi:hypothetical protein
MPCAPVTGRSEGAPRVAAAAGKNVRERLAAVPEVSEDPVASASATEDTNALPRIESAIPSSEDVKRDVRRSAPLRLRNIVVACLACVLVAGGAVLLVAHPWNPDALSTRATEPLDTSMAGYPGAVEKLSGQDSSASDSSESSDEDDTLLTPDERTYKQLVAARDDLATYQEQVVASEERLRNEGITQDEAARASGLAEAQAIAINISNLITQLQQVDTTTGTYKDTLTTLLRMGNYVRNEVDACVTSWKACVEAQDPAAEKDTILKAVRGEGANYASLYTSLNDKLEIPQP